MSIYCFFGGRAETPLVVDGIKIRDISTGDEKK